jgi:hypothetical protein
MNTTCPPNNTGRNVNLGNRGAAALSNSMVNSAAIKTADALRDAAEAYIPSGFLTSDTLESKKSPAST